MVSYRPLVGKLSSWRGVFLLLLCVGMARAGVDVDRMLLLAAKRYGTAGPAAVVAWRELLNAANGQPEGEKLRRVNAFFNGRTRFGEDSEIWGQRDYWATPLEVLGRGAGDCEDYAIAKYVTLKLMGIPTQKMRLTYVRARIGGPQSTLVQAHMVLSYYRAPEDEPLVLDSLISEIRPASRRPDLTTVFGFNAEGLWVSGAASRTPHSSQRLSRWQSVLLKMQQEGIE